MNIFKYTLYLGEILDLQKGCLEQSPHVPLPGSLIDSILYYHCTVVKIKKLMLEHY